MASTSGEKKPEKSYLTSAVESINPWGGSRSATPTPKDPQAQSDNQPPAQPDHSTSSFYGSSFRRYPSDCPPPAVQWFHAVDVPKRKPEWLKNKKKPQETKPAPIPKKYVAFSAEDSRSIEAAYQKVLEDAEDGKDLGSLRRSLSSSKRKRLSGLAGDRSGDTEEPQPSVKVPVNEDFLFDVDIARRELAPAYWLGPVYDVRRASWFYQEGTTLRPCEENLASQLEAGYLKIKPWTYPSRARSSSTAADITPKASSDNLRASSAAQAPRPQTGSTVSQHHPQTLRLFGTYMNQIVTYQDSSTAWLSSEGVVSWVSSTLYERFAGGGYMSGVKLVRGYSEAKAGTKEEKRPSTPGATKSTFELDEQQQKALKRKSAPPGTIPSLSDAPAKERPSIETRGSRLQRQLSSLMESGESRSSEQEEEKIREREEEEILEDYNTQAGDNQGRDIEHVILVTHGIGQLMGLRMDSINFVHDVNTMRKTLKSVYSTSADLRALNSESGNGLGNCRIQVLPVCWRHLLDFPKKRTNDNEHDLGRAPPEELEYPSLEDITIEGVAFARSLISDLALDVLLYQSAYREQIIEIVLNESNRIYKLFMERNPGFQGKVHIMGHSLGSAIMFDILCRQKERKETEELRNPLRFLPDDGQHSVQKDPRELKFDFDVEDFYCLGSPVGLFQMLKGRTIAARSHPRSKPADSPFDPDDLQDPFLSAPIEDYATSQRVSSITGLPFSVSSPKVKQLFNIFHPSDPISYRIEPLILPAMSTLKPQNLPYTKKGIFSNVAPQGLTGIGATIGQSVSGFWSNISAGIATSILNKSLGLSHEDVAKLTESQQKQISSPGAGTNISAGVISDVSAKAEKADARKRELAEPEAGRTSTSGNDVTLIDDDLETLYSRFQKTRAAGLNKDTETSREKWSADEIKGQKIRGDETKVRALNRNGRVDYSIQESVLDFNPINTIASHMAYWGDEDVNHFIMSQLLASKTRSGRVSSGNAIRPGQK